MTIHLFDCLLQAPSVRTFFVKLTCDQANTRKGGVGWVGLENLSQTYEEDKYQPIRLSDSFDL